MSVDKGTKQLLGFKNLQICSCNSCAFDNACDISRWLPVLLQQHQCPSLGVICMCELLALEPKYEVLTIRGSHFGWCDTVYF